MAESDQILSDEKRKVLAKQLMQVTTIPESWRPSGNMYPESWWNPYTGARRA